MADKSKSIVTTLFPVTASDFEQSENRTVKQGLGQMEFDRTLRTFTDKLAVNTYKVQQVRAFSNTFSIGGYPIQMIYSDLGLMEYFTWQMKAMITDSTEYFAQIQICKDETAKRLTELYSDSSCASMNNKKGHYEFTTGYGKWKLYLQCGNKIKGNVFVWNKDLRKGWLILNPDNVNAFMEISHNLTPLIALMAADMGMIIVHGAVVGIKDYGCLITGLSGSGKSSLAAACLANGLQYVSDDTVLISERDKTAYPVCTTIHLGPGSYNRLPQFRDSRLTAHKGRADKYHIDISPWSDRITPGLKVNLLVESKISDQDEVVVTPAKTHGVLMPMLFSSVFQIGEERDSELSRRILKTLNGLPAYYFSATGDFVQNANVLRDFLSQRSQALSDK